MDFSSFINVQKTFYLELQASVQFQLKGKISKIIENMLVNNERNTDF